MAYAFNDDKSIVDVYTKGDFVIVESTVSSVQLRREVEKTIDITDSVDDADNYALISIQYYLDPSPAAGSMTYVGKWISLEQMFEYTSGNVTDAKIYPRGRIYNDETDGHHVYARYWVRNESDRPRDITIRMVLLKIN